MKSTSNNESGFALLLSTIIILAGTLGLAGAYLLLASTEIKTSQAKLKALQSYYASEAGVEDAVYRVKNAKQYQSSYTLAVGQNQTTVTVNASATSATVESRGDADNRIRKVQTTFDLPNTTVGFNYGSQIGDGGLIMGQNTQINGSVYSNGSITGASGARIAGSAWVAQGTAPSIDQSWTTYNADYGVGTVSGSVISTLDSSGDVGKYTSLALGSDGFARISYYDATNQDLKFARCLDANCATKNVTAVDSAGNVGFEYTSIAIGSLDGLARISYYDESNKDLKFVRCTNDDCTTKVITVVESSGDVGQFSSLALGSDQFARISYYAVSGGNLKFAQCTNADCTTKNISTIDSSGDVGKYTSLALGSDGFARISYVISDDLKFARCTNADCSAATVTIVDSSPNIDRNTAIALGDDGFARISYYDDGNNDLKFVQCANTDCTTKNISTVDSSGDVGRYGSLKLLSDLARIVYYDGSNGDLKYIQCANDNCSTKNISVPDPDNVGQYTSLVFGSDNFGRISYYDVGNGDLKFLRCTADPCAASVPQVDAAQSFQPTTTTRVVKADLYLKKVGSPTNATLRLIADNSGSPGTNVLATGFLNASSVGSSYSWLTVNFSSTPTLNANTTYWLVIDAVPDNSNYLVWGGDSTNGYTRGTGKKSNDWSIVNWSNLSADLNFRVYMGGTDNQISTVQVDGNAYAHSIISSTIGGSASGYTIDGGAIGGSADADTLTNNCTIGGNAEYNSNSGCTIGGTSTTPSPAPSDPAVQAMPITQAMIDAWKAQAEAGGTINGDCGDNGVSGCNIPNNGSLTLGPKKIIGNLIMGNNQTLIVTGTIYVTGSIDLDNGSSIRLDPGYGTKSGVVFSDGTLHLRNNGVFSGSGQVGSYLMLMSLASGGGHHGGAIDLHNNADGVIFYAPNSLVYLHQNVNATQLTAKAVEMDNNATITYDPNLANALFSGGGTTGSFKVKSWKEVE